MSEPPKKDYPPGWNDPPMLNYSTDNPPPKSRIGNKRVAFPLGTSSPQSSVLPSGLPEMPPLPKTAGSQCVEELYIKASKDFSKALERVDDENVKEQIWQMLSAWQNRKFSVNVQNLLAELVTKIAEGNVSAANEILLKLTMPAGDILVVQTYLPALKHLIAKL